MIRQTKENRQQEVRLMKKGMIALGLVAVMLFGVSYVYAQEQSDPPATGVCIA